MVALEHAGRDMLSGKRSPDSRSPWDLTATDNHPLAGMPDFCRALRNAECAISRTVKRSALKPQGPRQIHAMAGDGTMAASRHFRQTARMTRFQTAIDNPQASRV